MTRRDRHATGRRGRLSAEEEVAQALQQAERSCQRAREILLDRVDVETRMEREHRIQHALGQARLAQRWLAEAVDGHNYDDYTGDVAADDGVRRRARRLSR